ncbi:aldehyde dehydrogenase family protein [Streptomyces sp. NPDC048277]|uniref:aldehyde dehydrogenase family protein n=1 Tax=Streptomyces sp. NPDC048277 TaxID=3155027 RepID=UPI0033E6ABC3
MGEADTTAAPDRRLRSLDPATGNLVAELPLHAPAEVGEAVHRARRAAEYWSELPWQERRRALLRWAAHLVRDADALCALVHAENGKPADDAYLELALALGHIRWAARHAGRAVAARRVAPGTLMANFQARVERRPLGVVGVIGPWNYPVNTPIGSIAYALAAGNTVVFKPSEHTPAVGRFCVEAFTAANPGLPVGVLGAVFGEGGTGAALVASAVDLIAFTGSAATGRKVMASAAERLTPVLLELGGKDPVIVAADADVESAAEAVAWGAMSNAGQTCIGVERVYVERSVAGRFHAALRDELRDIRAGGAYGPMTVPEQVDVVRRHLVGALEAGGTALVGGPDALRPPYIDPIVLVDVPESHPAMQEETFGPLVVVRTVDDVEQAVQLANGTRFGLGATVFSRRHGLAIARRLRCGTVSVNAMLAYAAIPALPFGGMGDSGFGRIHGLEGLHAFTRTQALARRRFPIPGMTLPTFRRGPGTMRLLRAALNRLHGHAR